MEILWGGGESSHEEILIISNLVQDDLSNSGLFATWLNPSGFQGKLGALGFVVNFKKGKKNKKQRKGNQN